MQNLEKRIEALEQTSGPAAAEAIAIIFCEAGNAQREGASATGEDGRQWQREQGESEAAFLARVQREAHKPGRITLVFVNADGPA
ncbi:MAG: hypothetical protein KDF56_04855 [Ottowia sp.]|nr:hypothetical protein [Ottowia sp.]